MDRTKAGGQVTGGAQKCPEACLLRMWLEVSELREKRKLETKE